MRNQLIIKIPEDATYSELKTIIDMHTQSYGYNYPLYMFPGWEYEVVELSDPPLVITQKKDIDTEEFINAMRKAKLTVAAKEKDESQE